MYMRANAQKSKLRFLVLFAAAMQLGLHGTSALKVLFILLCNYAIGYTLHDTRLLPAATWTFNLAVLFANEIQDGYRFAALHPSLTTLVRLPVLEHFQALIHLRTGRIQRRISALARNFQHHNDASRLLQHGLVLGCP